MTGHDTRHESAGVDESDDVDSADAELADDGPVDEGSAIDVSDADDRVDGESLATDEPVADGPIVLFDGVCNLCNGLVDWVVERDSAGEFYFASLQSDAGRRLLERHDLPTDVLETFVLIDDGTRYTKSTAALELFRRVGFPYSLLYPAIVLPRFVRDRAYDFVANRRYAWFGERDSCRIPSPELEERFLE